jgi:HSP20 family protein
MTQVLRYKGLPGIFNDLLNDEFWGGRTDSYTFNPAVNIFEDSGNYIIELAVPGYSKEDLKVTIDKNQLTVSYESNEESNEPVNYLKRQFGKSNFSRSFELPKNAKSNKIEAAHNNGVLTISIPKTAKVEIPVKDIEVK